MHIRPITHLMIAGSWHASPEMLRYARRVVCRAHELGWTVLVSDNAKGVDLAVVQQCRWLGARVIVAGTGNFPRNGGCRHGQYVRIERDLYRGGRGLLLDGFTVRDRWLVDMCQKSVFIWNGSSQDTLAGYEYAVERRRVAFLKTFTMGIHRHAG